MTDFAKQYQEYQHWRSQLNDTPEAWVAYKALQDRADQYDPVANNVFAVVEDLIGGEAPLTYWGETIESALKGLGYFDDDDL